MKYQLILRYGFKKKYQKLRTALVMVGPRHAVWAAPCDVSTFDFVEGKNLCSIAIN
jgi:hypothetical protein